MRWWLAAVLAIGCGDNQMTSTGGSSGHLGSGGSGGSGGGMMIDAAVDAPAPDAAIDARPDAPPEARIIEAPVVDAPPRPDGAPFCDPTQPDGGDGCADPANPKCAVTFPNPQGGGVLQCEPAGSVLPGSACVRVTDSSGNELAGVD